MVKYLTILALNPLHTLHVIITVCSAQKKVRSYPSFVLESLILIHTKVILVGGAVHEHVWFITDALVCLAGHCRGSHRAAWTLHLTGRLWAIFSTSLSLRVFFFFFYYEMGDGRPVCARQKDQNSRE